TVEAPWVPVTVPLPVPALPAVSVNVGVKVAVTVVAAETVTEQLPVPAQPPPLQPVKAEPAAGLAESALPGPVGTGCEATAPQLMTVEAPWVPVTVPLPVPALAAVSVKEGGGEAPPTEVVMSAWISLAARARL